MFSEKLKDAARDYRFLLNKSYPQKATIKLVGDKNQLTGEERSMLYRGISDEVSAKARRSRIVGDPGEGPLYVDSYNILYTIGNYLVGRPVYLSDDGILRDTGELRGRFGNKKVFEQTLGLVEAFMLAHAGIEYHYLLDAPVSNSGRLACRLEAFLAGHGIRGTARTVRSPDHELILTGSGLVCTSDSVIMTKVKTGIFDMPRHILSTRYGAVFDDISAIFE